MITLNGLLFDALLRKKSADSHTCQLESLNSHDLQPLGEFFRVILKPVTIANPNTLALYRGTRQEHGKKELKCFKKVSRR
jgi:hypothetical protein